MALRNDGVVGKTSEVYICVCVCVVCGVSRGRAGDWPGLGTEAAASVHVTLVSASPG